MLKKIRRMNCARMAVFLLLVSYTCPAWSFYKDNASDSTYIPDSVDCVVKPLVPARWNFNGLVLLDPELTVYDGVAYYNYYLPRIGEKNFLYPENVPHKIPYHAAVGCTNTAIGQIMYTHSYPEAVKVPGKEMNINIKKIFHVKQPDRKFSLPYFDFEQMRGGTAAGHFYDWEKIRARTTFNDIKHALDLEENTMTGEEGERRAEVAALLHDIGLSTGTTYELSRDRRANIASVVTINVPESLRNYFYYESAFCCSIGLFKRFLRLGIDTGDVHRIINPNLEMGMPVILDLGATGSKVGHTVVVDGYGYDKGDKNRILHHILFGHGYKEDGWYDLSQKIGKNFDVITGIVYNIFPNFSGELVGGRVFLRTSSGDVLLSGNEKGMKLHASLSHSPEHAVEVPIGPMGNYVVMYDSTWPDQVDADINIRGSLSLKLTEETTGRVHSAKQVAVHASPSQAFIGTFSRAANEWPIDFLFDESVVLSTGSDPEGFMTALTSAAAAAESDDAGLNQSFIARFGSNLNSAWDGENTDVLFVETFPYYTFLSMGDRFPWINELIDKAETVARNGGIVYVTGESWPFAKVLAGRAGKTLNFYGENEIRHRYQNGVPLYLHGWLQKNTGMDNAFVAFTPDETAPIINPATTNGLRSLATGEIVVETGSYPNLSAESRIYPMAVEFDIGKGRVIYTSFTMEPNLKRAETVPLVRALVAEPLKYAQERRIARKLQAELDENIEFDGYSSLEAGAVVSRDFEVDCSFAGDMTFVLQVTDQTLGLDIPSFETLHTLDVSLFTPDGELFGRQRINGTRVSFPVSADTTPTPEDYVGVWRMKINEIRGFTPRQVLVSLCVEGLRSLDNGDPGYDPDSWKAPLNFIEGTDGADTLIGISNPNSVDIFIGKGGDDTYMGGTAANVYTWNQDGGNKTILNSASAPEPSGILWIGEGTDITQCLMERVGSNLVINLRDEDGRSVGSVTIRDWYAGAGMKLEAVLFEEGFELTTEEIEAWVEEYVPPANP